MKDTVEKLEERVAALETKFGKSSEKPEKEKKPRKASEYNIFMGKFIPEYKKDHPKASHQDAFAAGAKEWKKTKK